MSDNLSVDNLRIHDEYVTYTHKHGAMPPPPPPQSDRFSTPMVVVKSTTTKASSGKPRPAAASKPHHHKAKNPTLEASAEVWVNNKPVTKSSSGAAPPKPAAPSKAPSKATAPVKVAAPANVRDWVPPPPAPENMALVTVDAIPPPPPPQTIRSVSTKASSSAKDKGMEIVKASAIVNTGKVGSNSGSVVKAGSKAGSGGSKEVKEGDKAAEDVMVTIEETYTRKISFPVKKGESMKYAVKGGSRGFSLGGGS
ncbi:hypothetical protein BDV97DRAFT_372724 [Delphinella strobiligena]|nr:hypothetical protein BDV97DRAFT_372724 [Delphinella strobiligena]